MAKNATHVYTKQHKALGFQPGFAGPFPIEQWISRSTVKIKVGTKANGEPTYEVRHLNDLKFAHEDSHTAEASRKRKGRPSKSVPDPTVEVPHQPVETPSNPSLAETIATIDFTKPPPPLTIWSASPQDIKNINNSINANRQGAGQSLQQP